MAQTDTKAMTSKPTNRTIFVPGLRTLGSGTTCHEEDLRSYFSKYGTVTEVSLLKPHGSSAFVTFETSDMSRRLLDLKCPHKINRDTSRVRVYEAISRRADDNEVGCASLPPAISTDPVNAEARRCRIFVQRMPLNTTPKDIKKALSKYGTVTGVYTLYMVRHFASVVFDTWHTAQYVLEQEGHIEINGSVAQLICLPVLNPPVESPLPTPVETISYSNEINTIAKMYNGSDMASLAVEMRDTLRLIKCLEPAKGHRNSMISLYLNNGDSSPDDASVDLLNAKFDEMFESVSEPYYSGEYDIPDYERADRLATQTSIRAIQKRIQLNGRTSRRGIVIFCGTVLLDGGEMKQVLVEFEPYTLLSDKSFYYFDNKFHLSPLAFRLIHYQMDDGLEASNFAKVSKALQGDPEKKLASFNIDAPLDDPFGRKRLKPLLKDDSFLFEMYVYAPQPHLQHAHVAELTRILRLVENFRVCGDDNMKKMILIFRPGGCSQVKAFLDSDQDLKKAQDTPFSLMGPLPHKKGPEWFDVVEELKKVGSFPGDLSAKRCIELAEERVNSYSQISSNIGLIIYCGLGMSSPGKEMKFSVEIEPSRYVARNKVIYMPEGPYNLQPLEELLTFEDLLVPFALDPKNAPPGTMSQEKRELLIRLVDELASEPAKTHPPSTSRPIVSRISRLAKKVRKVVSRLFH